MSEPEKDKVDVWFLLIDHETKAASGNADFVEVYPNSSIARLLREVKEKKRPDILDFVWRCKDREPLAVDMSYAEVKDQLKKVDFADEIQMLGGGKTISTIDLASNEILLIEVPATSKRPRSLSQSQGSFSTQVADLKRKKIVEGAPSGLALTYDSIQQNPSERLLDDIPAPDNDIPPVSLSYLMGSANFSIFSEATVVFRFAEKMCKIYPTETSRNDACLEAMNTIWEKFGLDISFRRSSIGACYTDGHILTQCMTLAGIRESRNKGARTGGLQIQMGVYAARKRLEALQEKKVSMAWRAPYLGISTVDSWIGFYAILFIGTRVRVISLTPWLSCTSSSGEGDQRRALYAAFTAASALIKRILDASTEPDVRHDTNPILPYITELPLEGDSPKKLSFKLVERFGPQQDSRLLYRARTKGDQEMIVKFSRKYSIGLHKFCAKRSRAPSLLGYGSLPGGWIVIAMDLVTDAKRLDEADIAPESEERKKLESDLRELVTSFHEQDLVHGDLRGPNILYGDSGRTVMLVDFDWGGKDGEASYSTVQLCEDLLYDRDLSDLKIRKQDDVRILERTLDKIRFLGSRSDHPW